MFDQLRIRTKLIAIIAAPLLALVVLAAIGSSQRRSEADTTSHDARRIRVIEQAASVAHELQREVVLTVSFLEPGGEEQAGPLKAQRKELDSAVKSFRGAVDDLGDRESVEQGAVRTLYGQLDFLSNLRGQVDAKESDWYEMATQYYLIDEALLGVETESMGDIEDPELATSAQNLAALEAYKTSSGRVAAMLVGIASDGSVGAGLPTIPADDVKAQFVVAANIQTVQLAVYEQTASSEARAAFRNEFAGTDVDRVDAFRNEVLRLPAGSPVQADAGQIRDASLSTLDKLRTIDSKRGEALVERAESRSTKATQGSRLFLLAALAAVGLSLGLAWFVAASITRPLRRLTGAVDELATEQLPRLVDGLRNPAEVDVSHLAESMTPISGVGGAEEVTHLANAVNAIQTVAVEVATEQAKLLRKGIGEMFVNLARRNQALLDRQIEFIDQLEHDEQDPEQLENLFKLDHLATRMRRNAESLLVLAGAEPPRKRGRPVPMTDVIRAALGEIDDYGRIELLSLDDVRVSNSSAQDVAHLLSELMENATSFSPPDTRVEVVGHRTKAEGYVVSITDHGIGMSAEALAEANQLLAQPPLMGLSMQRSLGFIVVGRLAQRLGISVRVMASPDGGVTSVVSMPKDIVVSEEQEPAEAAPSEAAAPTSTIGARDQISPNGHDVPRPVVDDIAATAPSPAPEVPAAAPRLDVPVPTAAPTETSRGLFGAPSALPPERRIDVPAPTSAPPPDPAPAPAPVARRQPDPVEAPVSDLFAPPAPASPAGGTARTPAGNGPLFGAPPAASPATPDAVPVPRSSPTPPAPVAPAAAAPVAPAPPAPAAPPLAPTAPTGTAPGGAEARLFGGAAGSTPESTPVVVEARTDAGLAKRVPRKAGGDRKMPGSDGERSSAAAATARSPEEVRNMLSRFRTGKQQAGTGAPTEPDTSDAER